MLYGLCMGSFAAISGQAGGWRQMLAAVFKVPALFLMTLVVTFPSLYVFNALVGSRLTFVSVLRLLVAALGVMLALLSSFGTIVAFFSFTTTSYPFMVLLNVLVFAISGFLGLTFLLRTLHRLTVAQFEPEVIVMTPPPLPDDSDATDRLSEIADVVTVQRTRPDGALNPLAGRNVGRDVTTVFRFWIIVFGLVGAQMSWVLRPFIGGGREFDKHIVLT